MKYRLEQYSSSENDEDEYDRHFAAVAERMVAAGWRIHTIDMSEWCNYVNVLWVSEDGK